MAMPSSKQMAASRAVWITGKIDTVSRLGAGVLPTALGQSRASDFALSCGWTWQANFPLVLRRTRFRTRSGRSSSVGVQDAAAGRAGWRLHARADHRKAPHEIPDSSAKAVTRDRDQLPQPELRSPGHRLRLQTRQGSLSLGRCVTPLPCRQLSRDSDRKGQAEHPEPRPGCCSEGTVMNPRIREVVAKSSFEAVFVRDKE
jgi:hypothetical protein